MKTAAFLISALGVVLSISASAAGSYNCDVYTSTSTSKQNPVLNTSFAVDSKQTSASAVVNGFVVAATYDGSPYSHSSRAVVSITKNGVKSEIGVGPDRSYLTATENGSQVIVTCLFQGKL